MSASVHRITALLLALALTIAMGTQGLRAAHMTHRADEMRAAMVNDVTMPAPSSIGDCAGKGKRVSLDCSAVSCGLVALPVIVAVLPLPAATSLSPYVGTAVVGHRDPPEPYPPRTTILG